MSMSDPISDYLTRIRNAHMASKPWVDIPSSSLKIRISFACSWFGSIESDLEKYTAASLGFFK